MRVPSLRYNVFLTSELIFLVRQYPAVVAFGRKNAPYLCQLLGQTQAAANLILARIVAISPLTGIHAPLLTTRATVRVHLLLLSISGRSHFIPGELQTMPSMKMLTSNLLRQTPMRSREPLALQIMITLHRRCFRTCAPCGRRGIYFFGCARERHVKPRHR